MITLTEVELVFDEETRVTATLTISLIELTLRLCIATTKRVSASVDLVRGTLVDFKIGIDMRAAGPAVVLAGKGDDAAACVDNQGLLLPLRAYVQVDIEILKVRGVSVKRS